jgi:hypothetical protein
MADNVEEANITKMVVLKSRYTGDVGVAAQLSYDAETGRLSEIYEDEIDEEDDDFDNIPF